MDFPIRKLLEVALTIILGVGGATESVVAEPMKEEPKEEMVEEIEKEPEPEPEPEPDGYEIASCNYDANFVSYMDYRANGEHTSQWQYQLNAYTNEKGIRETDGFLHIAIARNYNGVENQFMLGDRLILNMEGWFVPVMVAEWKGNTTCLHPDGSMIEFLVDTDALIRYNGGDNIQEYQRRVIGIKKLY